MLPTDEAFAPAIISQVKKAVVNELDGQAGWRVVSVNQNGVDIDVLNEVPGSRRRRSPSAWTARCRTPPRARSTAQRQEGDDRGDQAVDRGDPGRRAERRRRRATGPIATTGLYPPGSTFKIITAGAAIERDMATPNTLLGCPGHDRHRPPHDAELRRVRPRHRADVAGVRQFVQHHLRRTGQPDAAARADPGRRAVRHRRRTIRSRASTPSPVRCRRR